VSKEKAMELANEVDFMKNGQITYYEFANKMDYTDDFARKEDKIPPRKTPPNLKIATQEPPKTAAPVRAGSRNNAHDNTNNNNNNAPTNDFNAEDTALSVDIGGTAHPPNMSRQQSRAASRAGSGRATPNARPLDSKTAYLMLQTERAVHQHLSEVGNVEALPDGTPRHA